MEMMTAFGESKTLIDWLIGDSRVNPELTMDVLKKRHKRSWVGEVALTTPVIKGNRIGDSKLRKSARMEKLKYRYKMFRIAQDVRRRHGLGVEIKDLADRYQISRSQVEKMISMNEWANYHWLNTSVPDHFKEARDLVEGVPGVSNDKN
jgi:hypothetical protein